MARTIILYALALAVAVTLLELIEYRHVTRAFSTGLYIGVLAACLIALGIWAGIRLTPRHAAREFTRNDAGIASLGLTAREQETLELLASGQSIKEMARVLGVSPNTVKSHVAKVYGKLEVGRRVQAIEKARSLALIP